MLMALGQSAEFALKAQLVEVLEWQGRERIDAPRESLKYLAKRAPLRVVTAVHLRRIWKAPMGGDRLPGPHRADFAGRVITDGDDEIHLRRVRDCKLIPAFASQR